MEGVVTGGRPPRALRDLFVGMVSLVASPRGEKREGARPVK
jgi:hypothetical protein